MTIEAAAAEPTIGTAGVVATEAALPSVHPAASPDLRPRSWTGAPLIRAGVGPYLLGADLAALAVGVWAAGGLTGGLLVLMLATLWLNAGARLYRSRLTLSILEQAPTLTVRVLAAVAAAAGGGLLVGAGESVRPIVTAAACYLGAVLLLRSAVFSAVRGVRRRGWVSHPTLVLGAGQVGHQIATTLIEHAEYGLRPIGFLDSDPLVPDGVRPVPVLGGTETLADTILDTRARNVVIAFSSQPSSAMVDIIRTCDRLECELFIVPRLFELHDRSGHDVEVVWGMPLLRMREAPFRRLSWKLKRVVDVIVSGVALVGLAPVFAACAIGVRWETGPGVLFRQRRVGLDGRSFELLKFRSMRPVDESESATQWSIASDDRVGRFGRFLRTTSMDELPQLWNVLRGDMSIVGPRPERPHFVNEFATTFPRYMARHRVPCGMTGWAQIHGLRGDTSVADRARFDNYYIENWSPWLDLQIVIRTFAVVLTAKGR